MGISVHKKVSGFGRTPPIKKDGYAKAAIHDSVVPTKVGVTNKKGYSGPNVAEGSFNK